LERVEAETSAMQKRDDPNQVPLLPHLRVRLEHRGTKASYEADLADFNRFSVAATQRDLPKPPVPPNLLADYVSDLHKRGFQRETIRRRLCAIAAWYKENDLEIDPRRNDKVKRAWDEIRKDDDRKKERRLAALQSVVFEMLDSLDTDYDAHVRPSNQVTLSYLRDRALILVLYFGGMTRTEIATLYRENIIEYPGEDKTLLLKVNTSGEKIDPESKRKVWVTPKRTRLAFLRRGFDPDRCPVRAISQWIHKAGIKDGYVFRGVMLNGNITTGLAPRSVHEIITTRMKRVDVHDVDVSQLSAHSLRIGLAGSLAIEGKSDREILAAVGLRTFDSSIQHVITQGRALQGSTAGAKVRTL
jgi:site-specific recombinase XerC